MKTIVLDDDPTGTQSATGVRVLLESSAELLAAELATVDAVYVQTNSRAIDEAAAIALVRQVRADGLAAGAALGEPVRFVLRGDSTLRGHVFAETEQFLDEDDAVMLFVPAFPDGGRTTEDGMHYVRVRGEKLPAHESEFAADPVFPFSTGRLVDYVAEKSDRVAVPIDLATVRAGGAAAVIAAAPAGSVIVPDAVNNADVRLIAAAVEAVDRPVVTRSAAPLAAALAGVESHGLLATPLVPSTRQTLLVCGSHTAGATAQLEQVASEWGRPVVIDTDAALADPASAAAVATAEVARRLEARPLAVVTSERARSDAHNTLAHGEKVMDALTQVVRATLPLVEVVVAKGGITSADVARIGIGATSATVLGQVLPGVSVWSMVAVDGREVLYVVVPGNVGEPDTLVRVLDALSLP